MDSKLIRKDAITVYYSPASARIYPRDFSGGPNTHCALLAVNPCARNTGDFELSLLPFLRVGLIFQKLEIHI